MSRGGDKWVNGKKKEKRKKKRSHNFTASKPASCNGFIGRLNIHLALGEFVGFLWQQWI